MSKIAIISAPTMSSREIADLVDRVVEGTASQVEAEALAFRIICAEFIEFKRCFNLSINKDIDINEANQISNSLERVHEVVTQSANSFIHYPRIKKSIEAAGLVNLSAQSVLITSLYNIDNDGRRPRVKTYLAKNSTNGLIKIGKSINPISRIKQLETGSGAKLIVLAVIDDDIESKLHRQFEKFRKHGEWFFDDGSLSKFISELKQNSGKGQVWLERKYRMEQAS